MRCQVCHEPAIIDVRRHNANFCGDHFLRLCRDQVTKAISKFDMIRSTDRVLLAVSGGKDSLALWDILTRLGYSVDGLYVALGIGDYSDESRQHAESFATAHDLRLIIDDLPIDHGFNIPNGSRAAKRTPCSACGLSKRHLFDAAACRGNYDVIATGHNLDDEAAVLMGNTLHWHTEYLGRQAPVLHAHDGFPKKVKPLIRLTERDTAAYCVISGIEYIVDECPMAIGNQHLSYKAALNDIEASSPGAKHAFYFGFLQRAAGRFADDVEQPEFPLRPCSECGSPCSSDVCAFCRLSQRATGAVPTEMGPRRRSRKALK